MKNNQDPPVKPEKNIPAKPDKNPDPTLPKPGRNELERNNPTRIEEPNKIDPTRIDVPSTPKHGGSELEPQLFKNKFHY